MSDLEIVAAGMAGFITGSAMTYAALRTFANTVVKPKNQRAAFVVSNPAPVEERSSFVRKVTGMSDERTRTATTATTQFDFRVPDGTGILNARSIPRWKVERFMECATPKRKEYSGSNDDYSDLKSIGLHYQWLELFGNSVRWRGEWADGPTRQRRLRMF